MAKIIRFDAAAFKSRIEHEINNGNVNETQKLVDQFCESQDFNEAVKLPENFIIKLEQAERRKKMMRRNHLCKVIAIAAVVVCFAGGTVYATTNFFQKVKHTEYGLTTVDELDEQESIQSLKSAIESKKTMSAQGEGLKVIETVDGDANTNWIQKITSERPCVQSEDGINWIKVDGESDREVKYLYDNFEYALADSLLPKVFSDTLLQKLSLTDNASYNELYFEQKEKIDVKELSADLLFDESGKIHVEMSSSLSMHKGDAHDFYISTGTEKATNQRNYVTKIGVEYALCDNEEDGVTSTTTLLVYGKYVLILKFTDMTENQIHEFLEELDATVLSQE